MITCNFWRTGHRSQSILSAVVLLNLLIPIHSWAGPSYQDANMEYDFPRPLKVISKVSNGFRFEIVTPKEPEKIIGKDNFGSNSSWYGDEYLIVWPPIGDAEDWPNEPVYIKRLRSSDISFVENGPLSKDYIIIREWSSEASLETSLKKLMRLARSASGMVLGKGCRG